MAYLNIDDGMDEHPKIDGLSDAAFRLQMGALFYCARQGTDGAIPRRKARRLTDTATDVVVTELLDAGLWHDVGEGCGSRTCLPGVAGAYMVHDYLQWNHSAHWWSRRREEAAARGSWGMHLRWHVRRNVTHPDCKHCVEEDPDDRPTI